jgi:hypothetical protein
LILAFPFLAFCAIAGIDVSDEALLSLTAAAPFAAGVFVFGEAIVQRPLRLAVAACATLACVLAGAVRLPALSLANAHDARTLYRNIGRILPQRAILLTAGDSVDAPPLYFVEIEP